MKRDEGAAARLFPPLLLLLLALVPYRAVLPAPFVRLPYPAVLDAPSQPPAFKSLDHADQAMVVATVARNARLIIERPLSLRDADGWCYPMPRAYTLGEHMFGVGLLGVPFYWLTRDPIFTYNAVLILTIWLRGLAMYALGLHFTGRRGPALVAAVAFALMPERLVDPAHPFGHGDRYGPLVLLFLHRLFARGGVGNAAALAASLGLVLLESLYPVISIGVTAAVFSLALAWHYRRGLPRVAPLAVCVLLVAGAVGWWVFGPYLETRATWGVLEGRISFLIKPEKYLPGNRHFPGWTVMALVVLALLDRVRRWRATDGFDPRLAFLVAGLLSLWCSLEPVPLPWGGLALRSPLGLLRRVVPGLSAVRVLSVVAMGVGMGAAALAGFGALVLSERVRSRRAAAVAMAALVAAVAATRLSSPLARATFGRSPRLAAYEARPPEADLALLASRPRLPAADIPLQRLKGGPALGGPAFYLLLASYAGRPAAACYNSFRSPVQSQVEDLLVALPDGAAARALAAIGFHDVVVHLDRMARRSMRDRFGARALPGMRLEGRTERLLVYSLEPPGPVASDPSRLGPPAGEIESEDAIPGQGEVRFTVANRGPETFVHPRPLAPVDLVVRWAPEAGGPVRERVARGLLPLAIAPGATASIGVQTDVPGRLGAYRVRLATATPPPAVVGAARVVVRRPEDVLPLGKALFAANPGFLTLELIGRPSIEARRPRARLSLFPSGASGERIAEAAGLRIRWLAFPDAFRAEGKVFSLVRRPRGLLEVDAEVPAALEPGFYVAVLTPAGSSRALAARSVRLR